LISSRPETSIAGWKRAMTAPAARSNAPSIAIALGHQPIADFSLTNDEFAWTRLLPDSWADMGALRSSEVVTHLPRQVLGSGSK
jgi:hypothetical protein